ncbi:hypothetical protein ACFVGN_30100, partial [Streptomyces sp. NPDC057757]|uniref:hypothetical protein n=1 Tax=Streptomyces sp. NPDC057757 TaxID=3346241 RepID=UPI0036AB9DFE
RNRPTRTPCPTSALIDQALALPTTPARTHARTHARRACPTNDTDDTGTGTGTGTGSPALPKLDENDYRS